MDFKELLSTQGLSDEQVTKILDAMKENKLYTSNQENLDIRYEKLKTKHDDLAAQIANANTTIEELKKSNVDNTELQTSLDKYKQDYEQLKLDSEAKVKDITLNSHIKSYMKDYKVKEKYDDLLMSKIDKSALQFNDKGEVTGLKEIFDNLKTEYTDLFASEPPHLGGTPPFNHGSSTAEASAIQEQIHKLING